MKFFFIFDSIEESIKLSDSDKNHSAVRTTKKTTVGQQINVLNANMDSLAKRVSVVPSLQNEVQTMKIELQGIKDSTAAEFHGIKNDIQRDAQEIKRLILALVNK